MNKVINMTLRNSKMIYGLGIISLFVLCNSALADEGEASLVGFASYYISQAMLLGGVVMTFAFIAAGFKLLLGHGTVGDLQKAKNQLIGSIAGMVILLGSYAIINTINSSILNVNDFEIQCVEGIERQIKRKVFDSKTGKAKEEVYSQCLNTDQPDLTLQEGDTVEDGTAKASFGKCLLREAIAYSGKNFTESKKVIFKDETVSDADCPSADNLSLEGAKSIRFVYKQNGAYLYDTGIVNKENSSSAPLSKNEKTELLSPYYFKVGSSNFNDMQINDKIDTIEFASSEMSTEGTSTEDESNKAFGNFYAAILFSESNQRGKCLYVSPDNNSLVRTDKALEEEIDIRDDVSSMIIFKSPLSTFSSHDLGNIVLYAVPNCQDIEIEKDNPERGRYDQCIIQIQPGSIEYVDSEKRIFPDGKGGSFACAADKFLTAETLAEMEKLAEQEQEVSDARKKHYPIQSIKINGSAGVVIKSNTGNCRYFNLKDSERRGNCITNLQDIYKSGSAGEKPETIMVFPLDYK
jgi:hypothetical protein